VMRYTLQVPPDAKDINNRPQYYYANSLVSLLWTILKHRWWHFRRGDGWQD